MGKSKTKKAANLSKNSSSQPSSSIESHWWFSPFFVGIIALVLPAISWSLWTSKALYQTRDDDKGQVNKHCTLILAESTIPNAGMGLFSLIDRPKGGHITESNDAVIQVMDPQTAQAKAMLLLLRDYSWQGYVTGATMEGRMVFSILPGVGMLANSGSAFNVKLGRSVFNGAATHNTPYAGAVTDYSVTYYATKQIIRGSELLADYGDSYYDSHTNSMDHESNINRHQRSVAELRETGICSDNIQASPTANEGGFGAVATRPLAKGQVVAPLPVLPLSRRALSGMIRGNPQQLLLNYCYSHPQSSLMLFPYAPNVNRVNHATHGSEEANVRLQWSSINESALLEWSVKQILGQQRSGLVLELVALRDIAVGEEILLDYGPAYQAAWDRHVISWEFAGTETPSYMMNPNEPFRTVMEQQSNPLPANIRTLCLYQYEGNQGRSNVQWTYSNVGPNRWRPCRILERSSDNSSYTVAMENLPHMETSEVIHGDEPHVVMGVPAKVIRWVDEMYTTDQHLPNAFRHEIHIPDGVFPASWKDLAEQQQQSTI